MVNMLFNRRIWKIILGNLQERASNIKGKVVSKPTRLTNMCTTFMKTSDRINSLKRTQQLWPCQKTRSDLTIHEKEQRFAICLLKFSRKNRALKDSAEKFRTTSESRTQMIETVSFQEARPQGIQENILIEYRPRWFVTLQAVAETQAMNSSSQLMPGSSICGCLGHTNVSKYAATCFTKWDGWGNDIVIQGSSLTSKVCLSPERHHCFSWSVHRPLPPGSSAEFPWHKSENFLQIRQRKVRKFKRK